MVVVIVVLPVLTRAHSEPGPDRERTDDEQPERLFNEKAFLAGKIPLVKGGDVDPKVIECKLWRRTLASFLI